MRDARIVLVGGEAPADEIRLVLPMLIGRGREAHLTLAHPLVSRKHCEIYEARGELRVRDLESMNGTFIGNERITDRLLRSGDLLTIGTATFRCLYDTSHDIDPSVNLGDEPSADDTAIGSALDGTVRVDEFLTNEHESPAPTLSETLE